PRPAYTPLSSSSQTDEELVPLKQSLKNKSQYALYENKEFSDKIKYKMMSLMTNNLSLFLLRI
ncbi:5034_t:CDS:2, partial [Acaulospora morrowiae]